MLIYVQFETGLTPCIFNLKQVVCICSLYNVNSLVYKKMIHPYMLWKKLFKIFLKKVIIPWKNVLKCLLSLKWFQVIFKWFLSDS